MRILVLGASQGTGALCVAAALAQGHDVTAFARSPQKLSITHDKLTKRTGDFHDASSVHDAVAGHDAVIVTASSSSLKGYMENPLYFSQGTKNTIDAMKAHGVGRLVVLSALGVGDSRALLPFFLRVLLVSVILKGPFADHERQERMVMDSGLDWVVARPGRLVDGPAGGKTRRTAKLEKVPSAVTRGDVAAFLVDACAGSEWVRKAVQLGG